jgi:quercetin dioxygenase-like cupin family protein
MREPEHIHPYQENRFHILAGEVCFRMDGKEKILSADETISVSQNTPHYLWNPRTDEARYIQEFLPALKIDALFETFFALAREGKLNKKVPPIYS